MAQIANSWWASKVIQADGRPGLVGIQDLQMFGSKEERASVFLHLAAS
jgi:hypothetical protein